MDNILQGARENIDRIDRELTKLFVERMESVATVAKYKEANNLPVLNKTREREIIANATKDMDDQMAEYTKMLFITLFDLSKSFQEQSVASASHLQGEITQAMKNIDEDLPQNPIVACQGIEGANSAFACEKLFSRASMMYFNTFDSVFSAVERGLCQYGILPIENSLHGSVTQVYDLMNKYKFNIVRSTKVKIDHTLLGKRGSSLGDIKEIYSHPQAIAQCAAFLGELKDIKVIECENTAIAAELVAKSDRNDIAAIASYSCSELYNLDIINSDIQNNDNNYTRFICISKNMEIYPGADKISLMFTAPHKPGALYRMISKFSALGVNMSKIESRPIPGKDFQFMFYMDFDGNIRHEAIQKLLVQLEGYAEKFVFLGSYCEK